MKGMLLLYALLWTCIAKAQNMESLKPQLKQIALIKIYIGYLEKGYDIARKGLNTISDIKNGHWKLDIDFFNSLKNVKPNVRDYIKVAAITSYQVKIVKACSRLKKESFNDDEVAYVKAVADRLIDQCSLLVDKLSSVITDKNLQMSDDERIRMIDTIYNEVADQYDFVQNFSNEAAVLQLQRAKDRNEIRVSGKLNGL